MGRFASCNRRYGNAVHSEQKRLVMSTLEKIVGTMLMLVFVFLVLNNADSTKTVLESLSEGSGSLLKTLQGR